MLLKSIAPAPLLLATLAGLVSCQRPDPPVASRDTRTDTIHAVGYIEPLGELRRLAFQTSGVIARVECHIGDRVKAGDLLARLDDQLELARVASARARLEEARSKRAFVLAGAHPDAIRSAEALREEATLEKAHRESERARMERLRAERGVSAMAADEAAFQAAASSLREKKACTALSLLIDQVRPEDRSLADAEVETALAGVGEAEALLRQKAIPAPVDGTVLEIFLREGEAVSTTPPEPALLLAPSGPLEARVEVDERFATQLQAGAAAMVRSRDGSINCRGKVRAIKPVMGRKTVFTRQAAERMDLQILEAWITLEMPATLPIGTEVEVEIEIPAHAATAPAP